MIELVSISIKPLRREDGAIEWSWVVFGRGKIEAEGYEPTLDAVLSRLQSYASYAGGAA